MGLRLYQITDTTSKKPVEGLYFSDKKLDRKSTRLNSSHLKLSRMPSSA